MAVRLQTGETERRSWRRVGQNAGLAGEIAIFQPKSTILWLGIAIPKAGITIPKARIAILSLRITIPSFGIAILEVGIAIPSL